MQDKNYRVLAAFMGLVWFCIPVVLELLWPEGLADAEDPWWRHIGIWASFFLWPFSCLCCHNAFVDTKRRVGGWTCMVGLQVVRLEVAVIVGAWLGFALPCSGYKRPPLLYCLFRNYFTHLNYLLPSKVKHETFLDWAAYKVQKTKSANLHKHA